MIKECKFKKHDTDRTGLYLIVFLMIKEIDDCHLERMIKKMCKKGKPVTGKLIGFKKHDDEYEIVIEMIPPNDKPY